MISNLQLIHSLLKFKNWSILDKVKATIKTMTSPAHRWCHLCAGWWFMCSQALVLFIYKHWRHLYTGRWTNIFSVCSVLSTMWNITRAGVDSESLSSTRTNFLVSTFNLAPDLDCVWIPILVTETLDNLGYLSRLYRSFDKVF